MNVSAVVQDQSEVIGFLSTPQAYGLPAGREVTRIDTHGAAVFLVNDRAYKLKRAVRFSFMDFSTAPLRRSMCIAEVRLNRRTAPDYYLGVAAVERHGEGLRIGPMRQPEDVADDAVDWLVVMRRFPSDALLEKLAGRGELDPSLMVALADSIADFHARAERIHEWGGASSLASAVAQDIEQMGARGTLLDQDVTGKLGRLMPDDARRLASLADRRRDIGAVRRCHGDLHLGNIFLDHGRPVAFDAIEFNDRISCIDILYDLAFLLMDLDFRGLRHLANLVLNRYLWVSQEADADNLAALALLPLYLARRGAIRAHVDAAGVPHLSGQTARAQQEQAMAYQRYALACFDRPKQSLVAVGGLSGTGKTTLAMALAPCVGNSPGAVVLRSDVLRKRLAGVALDRRMPAGWYTPENARSVYEELMRLAAVALASGHSVIVDAVFAREEERAAVQEVAAAAAGVAFAGLWLEAPLDTLKQRVGARQGDASDATEAVVERQTGYDLGGLSWMRISAGGALEDTVRAAQHAAGLDLPA